MFTSIYIVLPAFNEEAALRQLIPDLLLTLKRLGNPFTLCLVDDGSTDGTSALARSLAANASLQYLPHSRNQGYGAAVKTGMEWVIRSGQPNDVVITMDADNTQPPSYIPQILAKLEEGCGVVTASYRRPGGQVEGLPLKRNLLSWGVNTLLRLRFRIPGVETYTNGYRGYRVGALQEAARRYDGRLIEQTGFPGGTELFIKVVRAGARAAEVPFALRYERRGSGSKIRIVQTILGYLRLLAC